MAAATTVIAGIMHLMMAPMSLSGEMEEGILFLVGGVLQVFWAVPVIKQWGRIWQVIGIVGTAVLMILWLSVHLHGMSVGPPPGNIPRGNITGGEFPRGTPPGGMTMGFGGIPTIEFFQIAFIGLYIVLSKMISKKQKTRDSTVS